MEKYNLTFNSQATKGILLFILLILVNTHVCSAQIVNFQGLTSQIHGESYNDLASIDGIDQQHSLYATNTYTTKVVVATKKDFKVTKAVKVTVKNTESIINIEASASAGRPAFEVGGKVLIGINTLTGKKTFLESGFIRGDGAEVSIDSNGDITASYTTITPSSYGVGQTITVKANVDGEFSNAEYAYNGENVKVKIIGNATGKVSATVGYTSGVGTSWSGDITITTNGGSIESVGASTNFNYKADTGGGLTTTFIASGSYNFIENGSTFMFTFNIPF